MDLEAKELFLIKGGSVSSTMLNAITRAASVLLDLGRTIGTTIRRVFSKNYC